MDTGVFGVRLETSLLEILHAFFAIANTNKTMTFWGMGIYLSSYGQKS